MTDTLANPSPARIPRVVWLAAVLAALVHIAPYWRAQSQTPPGWTFTGNIHPSPDYMQYRVWARQSQHEGILVSDRFTSEPNPPHLPVLFYYAIGQVSRLTGLTPEFVYAYLGCFLAMGLTVLLFVVVRHFLKSPQQTLWVFAAILIGGGLGPHLKILRKFSGVRDNFFLHRTLVEGLDRSMLFEDYRGHYVFVTLFDTHFILIWLIAAAALFSFWLTVKRFSMTRLGLTALLFGLVTILHVYEGITLLAATLGAVLFLWRKKLLRVPTCVAFAVCMAVVAGCLAWQFLLYRTSGLPVPSWRAVNVYFSVLAISYPLAWWLMACGIVDYWKNAGSKECFLLGWVAGCTALTLSTPFYPYPDRGTLTLQIPIYIVAGTIYFQRYKHAAAIALPVFIAILCVTPVGMIKRFWDHTTFDARKSYMFMSAEHLDMVGVLRQRAKEDDLLVLDKSMPDWEADDLWLAPEYPGKLYCGHFFLTVDYDGKRAEVNRFFKGTVEEQAAFLGEKRIRFLYVPSVQNPSRFERVPKLVVLKAASVGTLFEYTGSGADKEGPKWPIAL